MLGLLPCHFRLTIRIQCIYGVFKYAKHQLTPHHSVSHPTIPISNHSHIRRLPIAQKAGLFRGSGDFGFIHIIV